MDNKYIPPSWKNVKIIKDPKSKYYAIGYDSKGREQRLYNQKWIDYATNEKFKRLREVEKKYSRFKTKINTLIALDTQTKDTVIAYMCWIMELLNIRIGNEVYLDTNGSYGLTTLSKKSFKRRGNEYCLEFIGKKGVKHVKCISNDKILTFLKRMVKSKCDYLFCYQLDDGTFKNISSVELNTFIKNNLGSDFTAKDIRTYSANKILTNKLKRMSYNSETERKRNITKAIRETAEELGNTPTVCRKHYIDPDRLKNY